MAYSFNDLKNSSTYKEADEATKVEMARNFYDKNIAKNDESGEGFEGWFRENSKVDPEGQNGLSKLLFGEGGSFADSAKEAGKGVLQTGVNILNAPVDLANTVISAKNLVSGSKTEPLPKSVELPDSLKPKDKYVKVAADVAPMLGGGLASMLGKGAVKGAGMAAAALSDQSANEKKVEDFIPQAEAEIQKNPERYKGISAKDLAQDFYDADKVSNKAVQAGSAALMPVGNTGGILAQMGKQAGIGAGIMGGGEATRQVLQPGDVNTNAIVDQTATGGALGAAGGALGGIIGKGARNAEQRAVDKLSKATDQGAVERIAESKAGDIFQRAIREGGDANAPSILTPGQVANKNTRAGRKMTGVEARSRAFNSESPWIAKEAAQDSGQSIINTNRSTPSNIWVNEDAPQSLDTVAGEAVANFRKLATKRYEEAKTAAQGTLHGNGIFEIPAGGSRAFSKQAIKADTDGGNVDLTPEARKLLRKYNKVKITTIDQADDWKRRFNEMRGKAQRAGDYKTADTLAEVNTLLKKDVDNLMYRANRQAGKVWEEADNYYATHVGDYGKKSVMGKLSKLDNENNAESLLFGAQNGEYNTGKLLETLKKSNNSAQAAVEREANRFNPELMMLRQSGRTDPEAQARMQELYLNIKNDVMPYVMDVRDSASVGGRMADAISRVGRNRAVDAATNDVAQGGINLNRLINQLEKVKPQAGIADKMLNKAEIKRPDYVPEAAKVTQLQDAAELMNRPRTEAIKTPGASLGAGDTAFAGLPAALAFAIADGGVSLVTAAGTLALRKAFTNKLFSRMGDTILGRDKALVRDMEWLSNPVNAQKVLDKMEGRVPAKELEAAITSGEVSDGILNSALRSMYVVQDAEMEDAPEAPQTRSNEVNVDDKRKAAREAFLQQERKEAARKAFLEKEAGNSPQAKATVGDKLYTAFASAETGGIEDPYIRTRAQDPSSNRHSSAYGPVQITYTLAEDYLNNKPDLFTKEERKYLERFVGQGKMMLWNSQGVNSDRAELAYGGQGYLNSPEDKKMYEKVAKKMLVDTFRRNNGNLQATITAWRGLDDPNYANKVAAAL